MGRFLVVLVVMWITAGVPTFDSAGSIAAQTKSATTKKKAASSTVAKKKASGSQKKASASQKKGTQSQKKNTQSKRRGQQNQNGSASRSSGGPKSSAEAKKLQEAAQRDIQQTKEKLRLNDQEIKTGLSDLNRLSAEIAKGRTQVQGLQKKVSGLNSEITDISKEIKKGEGELQLMREEYLKAVKKMRLTKRNQSTLAFIFASENFNQAMRRIRYMRQFSVWKERKSVDIDNKIAQLGKERETLAKAKEAHTVALGQLTKSQEVLESNHKKQEKLVATLRQNGDALQAHLVTKQREANKLKETISSLIAQEQARVEAERKAREKAEAERRAKAEAERVAREKAEAERVAAAERAAAEKASEERALAEKAAAEKALADKAAEKALAEKIAAEKELDRKEKAERAAAEKEAAEKAKAYKKAAEEKAEADRKFAEAKAKAEEKARKEQEKLDRKKLKNSEKSARKKGDRRLKNKVEVREAVKTADPVAVTTPKVVEKTTVKETAPNVSFASLRGKLPRPVDGSWRVTNPFGRHAMPEMPEIEYDNPGIDAEVAKGTSVKAVCGGKVSGVYKLAGYGNVVIVNHGDYYTVYGNLGSTNVAVGTQVAGGTALGTAGSDPDDPRHGSVHFEVWKGREKQNPSAWIR
ncbi:MAG: peptidoglycan DD-metalloendopeptidase family protein [Muribaculaceae bacterium]|nr:peptidoglycan DD-metalloendopeptidase family protein [Muribaculaceae bacterium]